MPKKNLRGFCAVSTCIEKNPGIIMEWSASCIYQNYILISVSKNPGIIFT